VNAVFVPSWPQSEQIQENAVVDEHIKELLAVKKGEFGEALILELLTASGRCVVPFVEWMRANWRWGYPRPNVPEPDLCITDEDVPHFIEVKYRSNGYFDLSMIHRMQAQRDGWSQYGTFDVVAINSQRVDKLRLLDLSRVSLSNYVYGREPLYRCMYTNLSKAWGVQPEAYDAAIKRIEASKEWLE
jgi:Holliday junction resolvase-like predicted endonuclease